MNTELLEEAISQSVINRDVDNAESVLSRFGKVKFCDEGYDDIINTATDFQDSEDNYLLYRTYDLTADNKEYHIIFYYGDNTHCVASYQIL